MFTDIRICSFNCRGLKSSVNEIQELAASNDIILLQETWLFEFELPLLSNLCSDFYGKGVSAVETDSKILVGRPHGGMAIMWRKTLGSICKIVDFMDKRLMGLEILNNKSNLLIINVYLPYCSEDNTDEFLYYLSRIDSLISDYNSPYIIALGDYNAHVSQSGHHGHKFGEHFLHFCQEENITLSDVALLPDDTYTYLSDAHSSMSWIDHLVSTASAHSLIKDINI